MAGLVEEQISDLSTSTGIVDSSTMDVPDRSKCPWSWPPFLELNIRRVQSVVAI